MVAHELGHLLTNAAHIEDAHNVMWGHDQSRTNIVTGHKRFNIDQETAIQNNNIGAH